MELSPFHSPSVLLCFRASEGKATATMSLANRIPRVYVWTLQLSSWDVLLRGHEWRASIPRAEYHFVRG